MPWTSHNWYILRESLRRVGRWNRFAVSGKGEIYSGSSLSHLNKDEIEVGKSCKLSGKDFGHHHRRQLEQGYFFDDGLKTITISYFRWRNFSWWSGASHLQRKVPRIYLPGTSSNVQSAGAQARKEEFVIFRSELHPEKGFGAWSWKCRRRYRR